MRKTILLTLALIAGAATPAFAANPNVLDIKHSITDDAIVFPETFEQDTQKLLEGWYMRNYTASDDSYASKKDANVSDEEITRRLSAIPTTIELPFNSIVRQYIDRYTKNSRPQVAAILGLGIYYMPIFEQALEERGLPQELKYLPVIESGLDPNAVSRHGATGLWQLMLATGKGLGLECNSLVDERRDPYASSRAAADLLKQLYDTYGDWSLTIAAYNSGPGAVNKAIRRSGIDASKADFWSIYPYLSEQTRGYVPMFIAATYVMTYYPQHNINPVLPTKPLVTDTIGVTERVHFDQISAVLGIPADEIRILNPQYREGIIPGTPERAYMLALPSRQVQAYIMSHDQIVGYEAEKYSRRLTAEPGLPETAALEPEPSAEEQLPEAQPEKTASAGGAVTVTHKVAKGETLSSIADKYGVSAADIRTANSLRRNAVRVGQMLTINDVAPDKAAVAKQAPEPALVASNDKPAVAPKKAPAKKKEAPKKSKKNTRSKSTTHKIKSGENLGSIARKYGTTVSAIKKANGMKSDAIRAGATLKIPAKK
ncbi:MAG: LysM peptidoglycan-binding domain-containing protein [Muribaculaceae bacterium]|nr:LysM peptidoglycan-binding domain-containing protein [Muribaculaceae bacterium]